MKFALPLRHLTIGFLGLLASHAASLAQKQVINRPEFGNYLALWRLTHDPVAEDQANYHSQWCWSHDGRYLAYTSTRVERDPKADASAPGVYRPELHVVDLLKNEDRKLALCTVNLSGSTWANHRNWLFYMQTTEADRGFPGAKGADVMRLDLDTGKTVKIGTGIELVGGVDWKDEWVFGGIKDNAQKPPFRVARWRTDGSGMQEHKESTGTQWIANPEHPMFFTRHDHWGEPFAATAYFWDLDGRNRRDGMLVLEAAHLAWQGNGEHLLFGDGPARGRRWNDPAPSNVHVLAAGLTGNLSACGRSGRFGIGDAPMFDFRSGDAWQYKYFLSPKLKPSDGQYASFDGEAKGSPDGTKVSFTARYDMEKGPVTELTEMLRPQSTEIKVKSTEGFPAKGEIAIWCEAIGYERKTATSFEGLTRGLHGTLTNLGLPGRAVLDLQHQLVSEAEWGKQKAVPNDRRLDFKDPNSPLIRQRGLDVYVCVVRKPDRPTLHVAAGALQLVPGESHYETAGYHLHLNGKRATTRLVKAGEQVPIRNPGAYSAVAVEWSGVESDPGNAVSITAPITLQVLAEPPPGFAWTRDRWLVNDKETSPNIAAKADEAVREVIHRYDGVIAREWHKKGQLVQHHDLNHEGKAIRRLTHEGGRLTQRDYFNREGHHTNRQLFAADGFITETILFGFNNGQSVENDHWWFEKGTPVRRLSFGSETVKEGDQWKTSPRKP